MDKPKATNKNSDGGIMALGLLVMDIVLAATAINEKTWEPWILVALLAAAVVALICFFVHNVILDENGIQYIRHAFTRRYAWEQVQKVGIEWQLTRGGSGKCGVIALRINGKKKRIPYTRRNMKCIYAYYGEPDYDRWGKEPRQC